MQVSTDEVYGSLGETGFFLGTTQLDPHSPYSSSKTDADLMVKAYFDTYKMPINIIKCSNNYGQYQFPEKLIPLLINNCLNHKDLPLYGDGMNIRDWLYVEDRKGHDKRYGIDSTKIKNELGWYPKTTFEIGIKKTIKWH